MNRWLAVFAASCGLAVFAVLFDRLAPGGPPGFSGASGASVSPAAIERPVPMLSVDASPKLKLEAPRTTATASPADVASARRRRLARSGTLALLVPDIERSLAAVRAVTESESAALTSLDDQRAGDGGAGRDATLGLSVPADRFEQTMDRLAALGGVRSRSVSADDVTDQLVDDEARLRNLRRAEADMLRIMDRSGTIPDVLDVENQLSSVRDQIERLDAERKSAADRVAYSAIALTLTTDADIPAAEPSPAARLRDAWNAALVDVREFTLGFAARLFVLVAFAPYWLAGVALLAGTVSAATARRRGRARAT